MNEIDLATMSPREYVNLVKKEAKGHASQEESEYLRSDVGAWMDALDSLDRSLDAQLQDRRAWIERAANLHLAVMRRRAELEGTML
jgi:hypothetical protein